jgi:ABC-type sugar transport system substrate-binding protein
MTLSKRDALKLLLAAPLAARAPFASAAAQPKIGVVVPTLAAQFWNNYVAFMKTGAKELGVDLVVLNADNKPDQMVKSLEDLVAQHVDGIIFTPYWATAARGITLAREAGIPVILTDSYPDFQPQSARYPNYLAFIGPATRTPARRWPRRCSPRCSRAPTARR